MPITSERIQSDLNAMAAFTESPGNGITRPTFSNAWRQARDYVVAQLEQLGCKTRIDAAGNLHARTSAISWESPAWLSGSHLDTVPNGGNYDGVAGVVLPLEVFRAAREDLKVAIPLELVVWAEGEGTTFGSSMLGSRAYVGELNIERLGSLRAPAGQNYLEAGAEHGVKPEAIEKERFVRGTIVGAVECHIEPGPSLWNMGCAIGVVSAISGRRQYRCTIIGVSSDAGGTQMQDRHDALTGSAEIILVMEKLGRELGHGTMVTVGQIACHPNAPGFIAGEANFSINLSSPAMEMIMRGDKSIHQLVEQIAHHRGLQHSLAVTDSQSAVELDANVRGKIKRVAGPHCNGTIEEIAGGTAHDAMVLAAHVPAAMLFISSRDGICHHPDEFCRPADLVTAAKVLMETVRDRRLE